MDNIGQCLKCLFLKYNTVIQTAVKSAGLYGSWLTHTLLCAYFSVPIQQINFISRYNNNQL